VKSLSDLESIKPRVVYTDLDGTMLGRGGAFNRTPDGRPVAEPMRALVEAQRAGIDVVPCSGRAVRGLVGDGRILGMDTVIAEMGSVIAYDSGRDLVTSLGAYPGGDEIPTKFMEECGAIKLLTDNFRVELHTPWARYREYTQLFRGLADTREMDDALANAGLEWLEIVDNGQLHSAYLDLEPGTAHAYHLLPRGVSKAAAVAIDQQRRSLRPEECIAIGDAVADLEIASEVVALVIVGDAVARDPALAARARSIDNVIVTERPGILGWTDVMNLLVET
jgi:hypothetical protein